MVQCLIEMFSASAGIDRIHLGYKGNQEYDYTKQAEPRREHCPQPPLPQLVGNLAPVPTSHKPDREIKLTFVEESSQKLLSPSLKSLIHFSFLIPECLYLAKPSW